MPLAVPKGVSSDSVQKTRYALFRGRVSGKNPFPVVFRYKKRVTTDPKEILLFSVVQA